MPDSWLALPLKNLTSPLQVLMGLSVWISTWVGLYFFNSLLTNTIGKLKEKVNLLRNETLELLESEIYIRPLMKENSKLKISIATIVTWIYLKFWILEKSGDCFNAIYSYQSAVIILLLMPSLSLIFLRVVLSYEKEKSIFSEIAKKEIKNLPKPLGEIKRKQLEKSWIDCNK